MEIKISIKDLCAEIVRKAWLLVIGMIIFAVLLTGYQYKKDSDAAKLAAQTTDKTELTDDEREAVNEYLVLKESLDGQKDYIENSLYMQLDPYHIVVTNLQFYIDTEDESDLTSAVIGLRNYITNGSLAAGIEKQNDELVAAYVQDVFSVNAMDFTSQNVSKIVNLKFYSPDKKTARAIKEAAMKQVAEFSADLQNTIGNHSITLMYEEQGEFLDKNVQNVQETYLKNFTSSKNNESAAFDALSEQQKVVAEEILGERENAAEQEEDEVVSQEEPKPVTPAKVSISKKMIVLGAIVGIFLMACVIAFFYLINATIKHPEEIRNGYGITNFGFVSYKKKNIFDTLADKLFFKEHLISAEQQKKLIVSKIAIACENAKVNRFVLTGQFKEESIKELITELTAELKKHQIEMVVTQDLANDSEAICKYSGDSHIVLAETIKFASYSKVHQEILMCREQKKEIMGYFTISI